MNDAVETFFNAWGMSDENARHEAIGAVYNPNGTYADPRSPKVLTGVTVISSYVSMFSENAPGWTAKVVKADETAGSIRATVAFGGKGPDGSAMLQLGQYFVDFDGDKISRMVGFVGTGEPE